MGLPADVVIDISSILDPVPNRVPNPVPSIATQDDHPGKHRKKRQRIQKSYLEGKVDELINATGMQHSACRRETTDLLPLAEKEGRCRRNNTTFNW